VGRLALPIAELELGTSGEVYCVFIMVSSGSGRMKADGRPMRWKAMSSRAVSLEFRRAHLEPAAEGNLRPAVYYIGFGSRVCR